VRAYNDESNSVYHSVPENDTIKAKTQVVAGVMYHIRVHMKESTCMKNRVWSFLYPQVSTGSHTIGVYVCTSQVTFTQLALSPSLCRAREGGRHELCKFKIWERLWLNDTHLTEKHCDLVTHDVHLTNVTTQR
jgi:hypothetical protein